MAASPGIDPALVQAAQRGDRMAQGELMDALIPFLGRLRGPIALQDGPDAVQEAPRRHRPPRRPGPVAVIGPRSGQ